MLEKDLQVAINKDLKKSGIKFYHFEKGRYHNNKTHRAGIPDLTVFKGCGEVFFVELKTETGKIKPEQIEFIDWCTENNYRIYVVRNIEQWELVKKIEGL